MAIHVTAELVRAEREILAGPLARIADELIGRVRSEDVREHPNEDEEEREEEPKGPKRILPREVPGAPKAGRPSRAEVTRKCAAASVLSHSGPPVGGSRFGTGRIRPGQA